MLWLENWACGLRMYYLMSFGWLVALALSGPAFCVHHAERARCCTYCYMMLVVLVGDPMEYNAVNDDCGHVFEPRAVAVTCQVGLEAWCRSEEPNACFVYGLPASCV